MFKYIELNWIELSITNVNMFYHVASWLDVVSSFLSSSSELSIESLTFLLPAKDKTDYLISFVLFSYFFFVFIFIFILTWKTIFISSENLSFKWLNSIVSKQQFKGLNIQFVNITSCSFFSIQTQLKLNHHHHLSYPISSCC